jgi:HAE1 family hydrophobic/amphiphilic exporter-1
MLVNYLLALLLVYIVMASQFESLAHPFAILVSIPFALWGAAWFLWATDSPFNLMGQIGVLILMGIVVKNGIVLIDHINNLRRKGYSREEAIELGGRERLRPILMTAATAVLALVPMAIGRTELDGLYYYPLARTVIGGLTASTFLTLVILPYIYVLFDNLAEWARNVWKASESVGVVRNFESEGG